MTDREKEEIAARCAALVIAALEPRLDALEGRFDGVRKALGTLANDMLELKYITGRARGDVADQLAALPKRKAPLTEADTEPPPG